MKTNEHIEAILDYMHEDEERNFIEHFNLNVGFIDDTFEFTEEHKAHIFYHVEMLNRIQRNRLMTEITISRLLSYSFKEISFDFRRMTRTERAIVGNQTILDHINKWVAERLS